MAPYILTVRGLDGSGRKTLIGSLMHQFGLELNTVKQLEEQNITRFDELPSFYAKNGLDLHFHGPSGEYLVKTQKEPDVAFWIVDGTDSDKFVKSSRELESLVSSGSLQPTKRLAILINKMDQTGWSRQVFKQAAAVFKHMTSADVAIVPISAFTGGNFMDSPSEASWVMNSSGSYTLVQLL